MSRFGPLLVAFLLFAGLATVVLDGVVFSGDVLSSAENVVRSGPFESGMAGPRRNTRGLGDQHRAFEPWLRYAADEYAETGKLPFWKDKSFCGAPLLGNGQSSLFFPPTLAAVLAGGPKGYQGALGLFKLILGAWFAYRLARHLGVSSEGAWISGITFSFFGFQVAWLTFPHTNVSFLLPLVILCADRAVLRPTARNIAWLALVTGLQHTGGHPETAFHAQVFAGIFVLVRAASLRKLEGVRWKTRILVVTGGFVLGAAVGSIQTFPLLEYIGASDSLARRETSGHGYPPLLDELWANVGFGLSLLVAAIAATRLTITRHRIAPWGLLLFGSVFTGIVAGIHGLLSPEFLSILTPDWRGGPLEARPEIPYMRASLTYIGPAFALALAGMLFGRPRPLVRVASFGFCLLTLVGLRAPLIVHFFDNLPVFSLALHTGMVLVGNLCGAILAGFGLDAASDAHSRDRATRRYLWATGSFSAALLAALIWGATDGPIGLGTPPAAKNPVGRVVAQIGSVDSDSKGRVQVRGWFESREAPERCQVVLAAGSMARADIEEIGPARTPHFKGEAGRYRFEATLPPKVSPRSRVRLWVQTAEGMHQSKVLRIRPGLVRLLTSFPVIPRDRRAFAQLGLFASLVLLVVWMLSRQERRMAGRRLTAVAIVALGVGSFTRNFNPQLPRELHYPPSPTFDLLRSVDPDGRVLFVDLTPFHETATHYGIPAVLGYDGVSPRHTSQLLRTALDHPGRRGRVNLLPTKIPPDARLAGAMGARYHAYPAKVRPFQLNPELLPVEYEGALRAFRVFENPHFLPRARLVASALVEPEDRRAWERLADPEFDLSGTVLLQDGEPWLVDESAPTGSDSDSVGHATIVVSQADRVAIDVEVSAPCYLVLSDTYFPGWEAWVDGEQREIYRANVAFRAVRLKPGAERVEFVYRPASFRWGAWVSGIGLAVSLLLLVFGARENAATNKKGRPRRRGRPSWGQWY